MVFLEIAGAVTKDIPKAASVHIYGIVKVVGNSQETASQRLSKTLYYR
jgi:hypothetical protein